MPQDLGVFTTMAMVLLVAAATGGAAMLLRQPLIVAFITVGVVVGPAGFGWIEHDTTLDLLASIGVAILLFLVGLRLDVQVIRNLGAVALATGLGQVIFTSAVGFVICLGLGLTTVTSLYVAVALTFSSTIIIVKLLSDKREIDALHGRIAVGFLIVQDLVVILAMITLSAFGPAREADGVQPVVWREAFVILGKGVGLLAFVVIAARWLLPPLLHLLARSPELLLLSAIAWAVGLAATGEMLGFSREVGAFLAGVSIASTPYRDAIGGRLTSLRDFMLLFFFIGLGTSLSLAQIGEQVVPALVLSLFVLIGNPVIVMVIMGLMGYRRRTGFLAGLTVAQISEFSLILCALGVSLGHIDGQVMGLVTLVGLITIGLSTYMILFSHPLYDLLAPWLGVFERRVPHRELDDPASTSGAWDAVVLGLGRYGERIAGGLEERGLRVLGVDFDPGVVLRWRREGRPAAYGDAEDPELPLTLPLRHVRWIVSTMPERHSNLTLLRHLREHGYGGSVALTARSSRDADALQRSGADLVLMPFVDAARSAIDRLAVAMDERS